MKLQLLGQQIL